MHDQPVDHIIQTLQSHRDKGLTQKAAATLLTRLGPNALPVKHPPPLFLKFFHQFKNLLVLILLAAAVLSFFLGDTIDTIAIFAIVMLNATIGFVQEIQAEKTLASLQKQDVLSALVFRSGTAMEIPATDVVPGDILLLEEGQKIPADARIIEAFSLHVDESILTGESLPTRKKDIVLPANTTLADRANMIYKDTQVTTGRGKAIVTATAGNTEIGKIAKALETTVSEETPLTQELAKVARTLTVVIGCIALGIVLLNIATDRPLVESILVAVSLAVAAIPEGLPAIVTIVLSLGVKRLAQKKAIVKKLPAVETLGAVKIIATDKTGTLTQNKIHVVIAITADGKTVRIEGKGYEPTALFFDTQQETVDLEKEKKLLQLFTAGVAANNAQIIRNAESGVRVIGDTTEIALLCAAERASLSLPTLATSFKRLFEQPFSSERKMMSVLVRVDDTKEHLLFVKGAPEVILKRCQLPAEKKKKFLTHTQQLAKEGLRSLALARRVVLQDEVKRALTEQAIAEDRLEFIGLVGMQDPLRPEVNTAIQQAKLAGIRTIMITGDHALTAVTIAKQAGIETTKVLTDEEVLHLSKTKLAAAIHDGVSVFARISPIGKLKIVEAIKRIPHTQVAVTGDGVNDAPALKSGHIGIAMGQTGTDLTREVADMVIMDDNYATIVDAIEEGRVIFNNLVKFIRYLISCNLSEVIVVVAGVAVGTPLPLLPIQILWINLITDGMPALALGMDPPEFDVMKKPPRDLSVSILHSKRWMYMMIEGMIMGGSVFLLFLVAHTRFSYAQAQSMTFAALALSQLVHAFNNRSTRNSLFRLGIFSNMILVIAVVCSATLQYLVIQTPVGNTFLKTAPLQSYQWLLVVGVSLFPLAVVEAKKQLRFRVLP